MGKCQVAWKKKNRKCETQNNENDALNRKKHLIKWFY